MKMPYLENVTTYHDDLIDIWEIGDDGYPICSSSEVLAPFLKAAGHYLIFARGCTWDGRSGFKIADTTDDILSRSYDISISPMACTRGGKVLICRESSHDVPYGYPLIVVALTNR